MEKKKHPPVHEGMIACLTSPFCAKSDVAFIAHIYGKLDSKCPSNAVPDLVAALEQKLTAYREIEHEINLAIANLRAQLEEHEMEEWKKKAPTNCPNCKQDLEEITQPENSLLNYDQWAAQRRGDFFCPGCHRFYFFVNGELKPGHDD